MIKVIFVEDSSHEQIIAMQGKNLVVFDGSNKDPDAVHTFFVSTTIEDADKLEELPKWKLSFSVDKLKRFEVFLSIDTFKKQINDIFPGASFSR